MNSTLLLSLDCPDRPGLISAITGELFNLGVNLGDTNFAVMGEGAEFSAVLETPSSLRAGDIEQHLKSLPDLNDARIRITSFDYGLRRGQTGTVTHHVQMEGDDQPGLVARLTELFLDYGANIVRMDTRASSKSNGSHYVVELWAWIGDDRAESCLAALTNTAAALGMECEARRVKSEG